MKTEKIRVGITHGDINGVGYEVIFKLFSEPMMLELCTPVIYGSPKVATYHRKAMDLSVNFLTVDSADQIADGKLNLVDCISGDVKIEFGKAAQDSGQAALAALEKAMEDYRNGLIDVLVTAPINKSTIQCENFHFPGHTEYIEEKLGDGNEALMILMNERLKVALVTTHLPLREVPDAITKEAIMRKVHIFERSLKTDFAIQKPRIAVLALNPHAGDNGLLGDEEQNVIIPAIKELVEEGVSCFGPFAADGFFGAGSYEYYDGVLAMYHDQGLSPFKTIAMSDGVNFTAGLPVVRTSPDHGTAYDIAGQGKADESSMRSAVYAAIDIFRNRKREEEAGINPLHKQMVDHREDETRSRRTDNLEQML